MYERKISFDVSHPRTFNIMITSGYLVTCDIKMRSYHVVDMMNVRLFENFGMIYVSRFHNNLDEGQPGLLLHVNVSLIIPKKFILEIVVFL